MLSTFLELNKKHQDYNPQLRNDGTLRHNMEEMHTTAQLGWLEGSGIFTAEKQAAFEELLASERAQAEARQTERLERRRIFEEREACGGDPSHVGGGGGAPLARAGGWAEVALAGCDIGRPALGCPV